jgi:hypothetical protein
MRSDDGGGVCRRGRSYVNGFGLCVSHFLLQMPNGGVVGAARISKDEE